MHSSRFFAGTINRYLLQYHLQPLGFGEEASLLDTLAWNRQQNLLRCSVRYTVTLREDIKCGLRGYGVSTGGVIDRFWGSPSCSARRAGDQ